MITDRAVWNRRILLTVFLVALVVRLPFAVAIQLAPDRAVQQDSQRYIDLAHSLLKFGSLGLENEEFPWDGFHALRVENGTAIARDRHGLLPEGMRPPAYPMFLAACFAVVDSPASAVWLQCVGSALAAVLLASAVRRLSGMNRGAWIAGLGYALHPAVITFDSQIMSESLFNMGAIVAMWATVRSRTVGQFVLAAAIAGFLGWIRPLGFVAPAAVLVFAWARANRRWPAVILVVVFGALPTIGWSARNAAVGNGFRMTTVADLTLYYYMAHYVDAETKNAGWKETWRTEFPKRTERLREMMRPGEDVYSLAGRAAREELSARPDLVVRIIAKSQFKLWLGHSVGEMARPFGVEYRPSNIVSRIVLSERHEDKWINGQTILAGIWTLFNLIVILELCWAILIAVRTRKWTYLLAFGGLIALYAAGTASQGLERLRLPLLVPIFMLIGVTSRGTATSKTPDPQSGRTTETSQGTAVGVDLAPAVR